MNRALLHDIIEIRIVKPFQAVVYNGKDVWVPELIRAGE